MEINSFITIGITTRNRLNDMDETLDILVSLGLNEIPMIIYDDASDEPVASIEKLNKFKSLTMVRNDINKGLIFNRNRIAEMAKTPYVISLDDDSCFANTPPLFEAIEYLEKHQFVGALEFKNIEINEPGQPVNNKTSSSDVHAVKSYTGCGHMIRRSTFLELNGYREYFFQMCEESDWGGRAWREGYEIHTFSKIEVHHRRTPVARMSDRMAFYSARNIVLCNLLNKPLVMGTIRAAGVYPVLIAKNIKHPKLLWKITTGWLNGFLYALKYWHQRTPMSFENYVSYQELPTPRVMT